MQFGSGSGLLGLLGGSDPLQEAMSRRQTGQAGVTAQQTPSSAGFNPSVQAAPMAGAPPPTTLAPSGGGPGGMPTNPFQAAEGADRSMIIRTLAHTLLGRPVKEPGGGSGGGTLI